MDILNLVQSHKWDTIRKLIKNNKLDPNEHILNNNTIVHLASINNQPDIIDEIAILNKKALEKGDDLGNTCSHIATKYRYMKLLDKCLDYNLDLINDVGDSILHLAIGDKKLVDKIAPRVNVNRINKLGFTPLSIATIESHGNDVYLDNVKTLLKYNADTNIPNVPPLHIAASVKNHKIAKLLLEHGADVIKLTANYVSPLILAVTRNDKDMVKLLLDHKADVNYSGVENRYNPLMMALKQNNSDIARLLLEHNIDTNFQDKNLNTPLHIALLHNINKDIIDILIEKGDLNSQNIDKITPIQILVKSNKWKKYKNKLKSKTYDIPHKIKLHDKIKLKRIQPASYKLITKRKTENGYFNADVLHSIMYTIIMLRNHHNLTTITQEFNKSKATNDMYMLDLIENYQNKTINNIIRIYTDYLFELAPYIILWKDENNYHVNGEFAYYLKKAMLSSARYVYIKITLINSENQTHANMVLIDKDNKTAERFEPYGIIPNLDTDKLDDKIEEKLKDFNLKYSRPKDYMPKVAFQTLSDDSNFSVRKMNDPEGYCLAWTFWYLEMRITNHELSQKQIVENSIKDIANKGKTQEKTFIDFIRNYAYGLDKEKNKIFVQAKIKGKYDNELKDEYLEKLLNYLGKQLDIYIHDR